MKSGGFLTPFPSGCPQEGPSTVLQSLTGDYPSFVLRLLAGPSWGNALVKLTSTEPSDARFRLAA